MTLIKIPHYYEKVTNPMDLGTMESKVKQQQYTNVADFRRDLQQIVDNSRMFNGPASVYTQKAEEILALADSMLTEKVFAIPLLVESSRKSNYLS